MNEKSKRFIEDLFKNYHSNPWQIPLNLKERKGRKDCLKRIIADYIAGMTDRFVLDEYKKLFSPYERV